jgi:hypothetical protein
MNCPVCEASVEVSKRGGAECTDCKIYLCPNCKLWRPWELGCAHDTEAETALCDHCFCDIAKHHYDPVDPVYDAERAKKSAWDAYRWRKKGGANWRQGYLSEQEDWEHLEARDTREGINAKLGLPDVDPTDIFIIQLQ